MIREVLCLEDGFVTAIDGEALGHAVVHLGGGRLKGGDKINLSVGLSDLAGLGEEVQKGVPLAMIHATTEAQADAAMAVVQAAYRFSDSAMDEPPLVHMRIA